MKTFLFALLALLIIHSNGFAAEILVADFDKGDPPNNIGGDYGAWNHDPKDDTQGCYIFGEPDDHKDPRGMSLRLDYDVQSKKPAFNGFWMKLKDLDATPYDALTFWVKGAADGKFTTRFKVELKDSLGRRAVYGVENVTPEWQEIKIDFKKSRSEVDWKKLGEFVIVFDDILATYKEGTVFVDQVSFKKA